MRFLLIALVLPGCLRYAGQFDPPPPVQGLRVLPERLDCSRERLDVQRWTRPDGSPSWPEGTVSTGGWDEEGVEFAAVTFWSTVEGASACDTSHEVAVWEAYGWRRP